MLEYSEVPDRIEARRRRKNESRLLLKIPPHDDTRRTQNFVVLLCHLARAIHSLLVNPLPSSLELTTGRFWGSQ